MLIGIWLLCGLLGVAAANARGWNVAVGFLAGVVLGPLSILLFFVDGVVKSPEPGADLTKRCGQCAEDVRPDAKVCRYCGAAFKW